MQNLCEFIFHNVGQGLFYSGKINDLNFIYDCGSENYKNIKKAVTEFITYLKGKIRIDLLILSHLHYDHVSGLELLLKKCEIETVILPYIALEERLLIAVRWNYLKQEWYFNFLNNPTQYFEGHGVKRIIYVTAENDDYWENSDNQFGDHDSKLSIKLIKSRKAFENNLKSLKVDIYNHYGKIEYRNIWVFNLHCFEVNIEIMQKFKSELKREKLYNIENIKDLILDNENRKKLKECYQKVV
ncbi:MBL fold metallo-hydrolase [Carboxydothermus pertinax]|uniref:Metallo-beta-lactamase domain-containing protein n=1 Tax=Carboxydothermus pertinax TaxID=870242 RepID=A0A1L8CWI4_9THEO|nr:MBL fold metallo-hydrolase [Carboxydothermus pertinax]GAV23286.1 hypothetical protein cpu_17960 [Carboxydothermus pertinax]